MTDMTDEDAEDVCGETMDHDLQEVAEGVWHCRRCGAEIYGESDET